MKHQPSRRNRGNEIAARCPVASVLESMEPRRLFSAAAHVHDHVLVIEGTRHSDDISISQSDGRTWVLVNNDTEVFSDSSFNKIRIRAGSAPDYIYLYTSVGVLVFGGQGNDHIESGKGNDTLMGEAGNDYLYGGSGNDLLIGGAGDDSLYGDAGSDTLFGENGNDSLKGGDGNDSISGGNGNDILYDGFDKDTIFGNKGDDHFFCRDSSRGWKDQQAGEKVEKDPLPTLGPPICACGTTTNTTFLTNNNLIVRPA